MLEFHIILALLRKTQSGSHKRCFLTYQKQQHVETRPPQAACIVLSNCEDNPSKLVILPSDS